MEKHIKAFCGFNKKNFLKFRTTKRYKAMKKYDIYNMKKLGIKVKYIPFKVAAELNLEYIGNYEDEYNILPIYVSNLINNIIFIVKD